MIIPKISDVLVSISLVHPQDTAGLNTTAIFVAGAAQSLKTYNFLDDVANDYAPGSSVLNLATTLFAQDASPDALQVITYVGGSTSSQASAPSSTVTSSASTGSSAAASGSTATGIANDGSNLTGIQKAAFDYFYSPWDYAILADYNLSDAQALAQMLETGGDDGKGFHLLFLQFNESNKSDAAQFAGFTRTWTYYHTVEGESVVAALTGEAGAQPTGNASWKFVSDLANVTPLNVKSAANPTPLTASQVIALEKQNLIVYVNKGNHSNFTDSINASGNYVDVYAGEDWVKANLESAIQDTLADVNGSGKVSFNSDGLAKIDATMRNVLDTGFAQGIIATNATTGKADYTVNVPKISAVTNIEIDRRVLNNVKFGYSADSEIGKVNVKGTAIA